MSAHSEYDDLVIGDHVEVVQSDGSPLGRQWGGRIRGKVIAVKTAFSPHLESYVIETCHELGHLARAAYSRDKLRKLDLVEMLGLLA